MKKHSIGTVLLVFVLALGPSNARAAHPVYSARGMAVSAEPNASEVGIEILKMGGNAFDAAAAIGFALAVTYPAAGNLGGGGFAVALESDGTTYALDFREKAPAAASRDMYLDENGAVVPGLSLRTHLAVGVPGSVEGLLQLAEERGVLDRWAILRPAIRLASKGFIVSRGLSRSLGAGHDRLTKYEATARAFYPGGQPVGYGDILAQRDLAATLWDIANEGGFAFYEGRVADLIVEEMKRGGGLITHKDLMNYEAIESDPFIFRSGEYELITHPLPSSGGVTIAQILGLLDSSELTAAGLGSARYVHRIVEAERLAYADRNFYLGDPDFVAVPVARLVSPGYLAERRALMPDGEAGKSEGLGHGSAESEETTHYCVADRWGNVVAVTTTLNGGFGMGAVVPGAGFLLNNEMDDFSAKPGTPNLYGLVDAEANAIEPGKRMLSSMTPTIVRKNGEFRMTMGSPGGATIITTVLQIYFNSTLFDMNIRDAIEAPRFHHQGLPDVVTREPRSLSPDTLAMLEEMGYTMKLRGSIGMAAGIERTEDGLYAGWADGRGEGAAVGY